MLLLHLMEEVLRDAILQGAQAARRLADDAKD
jgi:hypothetical protein